MTRAQLVAAAKTRGALALRSLRPCTLLWTGGPAPGVLGRDGNSQEGLEMPLGGASEKKSCRFYVLVSLLPVPPPVGTVFTLAGRDDKWELDKIFGGVHDTEWIFQCTEER